MMYISINRLLVFECLTHRAWGEIGYKQLTDFQRAEQYPIIEQ